MHSTTKLVDSTACLTSQALVDSVDSATWGLVQLSQIDPIHGRRDSMRRPLAPGTRLDTGPDLAATSAGDRGPEVEAA
jgi:hypothetical protein